MSPARALLFRRLGTTALPHRAHPGDAGLDLRAEHSVELAPYARHVLATGWAVQIPAGHVGLILPRSGLSSRGIVAAVGTIDSGYRGELGVCITNASGEPFRITAGDRIAQLVVLPCVISPALEVDALDDSERGGAGFGSTGLR